MQITFLLTLPMLLPYLITSTQSGLFSKGGFASWVCVYKCIAKVLRAKTVYILKWSKFFFFKIIHFVISKLKAWSKFGLISETKQQNNYLHRDLISFYYYLFKLTQQHVLGIFILIKISLLYLSYLEKSGRLLHSPVYTKVFHFDLQFRISI